MYTEYLEKLKRAVSERGYSKATSTSYVLHFHEFMRFCKKTPKCVRKQDIKDFIMYMKDKLRYKPATVNLAISAVKFYFDNVQKRSLFHGISRIKKEKKIVEVLSKEEVLKIIDSCTNPRDKLLIELLYASGLRVSECIKMKITELNIKEKIGKVRQGKGMKDRYIILSEKFISDMKRYLSLRKYKNEFLFPARNCHICQRTAQIIVHDAARKAGISKRVHPHMLRASFATHLLDSGVDIYSIQELLGHSFVSTTMSYIKRSHIKIKNLKSPLDID